MPDAIRAGFDEQAISGHDAGRRLVRMEHLGEPCGELD